MYRKKKNHTKKIVNIIALILLFATFTYSSDLNEALVFDWWDNGIISSEEANEILNLLEEDNIEEACLLAQVYAQESCESQKDFVSPKNFGIAPHGFVSWKVRVDSTGRLEHYRYEALIRFYHFTLRLGSQELLSYKNQGSEAYFGQISTKELHSQIPLDTLWGTSFVYPLGSFYFGGLLDSSKTTQFRLGYKKNSKISSELFYWHGFSQINSFGFQSKFPFGEASLWWQKEQSFPLLKFQLKDSEKNTNKLTFNWRTTAYIHKEEIPMWAHLSSTILQSRFWGAQTFSLKIPNLLNSKISTTTSFISPLDSDSIRVWIKAGAEAGPQILRMSGFFTCKEMSNNCEIIDLKGGVSSMLLSDLTLGTTAKFRIERSKEVAPPYIELYTLYKEFSKNLFKFILVLPQGNFLENLRLRSEFRISQDFLEVSIACIFKELEKLSPKPVRAYSEIKFLF